ncbi:hypothetical protein [Roseicyclus mahoneyensis]|uniref:Uncharacterized protein n=1 Tax=Roseicyclus mahoneyensis TaxID=164332 RepID=A0A316GF17_9RHOB|nr:hypothetical protein [Roseicyclus mahoneyensis]PWK59490.1 hypothetical protein C7455_10735 [Roseicyclus mahoneyensis]
MFGLIGLLPALLFVAFAAPAFLDGGDNEFAEPDPDDLDPVDVGGGVMPEPTPEPVPPVNDLDDTPPETEPDPVPAPDPVRDTDTDPGTTDPAPLAEPDTPPFPDLINEADGEDALITIDISNASLETLATDPDAPEDGFTAFLDSGDTLEIILADDVEGSLFVLDIANVALGAGTDPDQTFLSRAIYILPEGVTPPADITATTEEALIAELGLIRLGEIDLGQLVTRTDPNTGEITILEDTRQEIAPQVISNRTITTDQAVFA